MEKLSKNVKPSEEEKDSAYVLTWMRWVEEILQERDLITIFEAEEASESVDLSSTILEALFKVARLQRLSDRGLGELKLALAWNRIDMAKDIIFKGGPADSTLTQLELQYLLPFALVKNRVEFVKAFLARGVNLQKFLSIQQLILLYNECVCLQ